MSDRTDLQAEDSDSSDSDSDSDSDEEEAKPAAAAAPAAKAEESDSSDSDSDSSDDEEAPAAAAKAEESSSDEDSSDDEEETPAATNGKFEHPTASNIHPTARFCWARSTSRTRQDLTSSRVITRHAEIFTSSTFTYIPPNLPPAGGWKDYADFQASERPTRRRLPQPRRPRPPRTTVKMSLL